MSRIRTSSIVGLFESGSSIAAASKAVLPERHTAFLGAVGFTGKAKETRLWVSPGHDEAIAFVGLGGAEGESAMIRESVRQGYARGYQLLKGLKPEAIEVDRSLEAYAREIAEGVTLASYAFNLKTQRDGDGLANNTMIVKPTVPCKEWELGVKAAASQNLARTLVDTPANLMTPQLFCQAIMREANGLEKVTVRVYDEREIEAMGMGLLLGVAKGSKEAPRLLVLTYTGRSSDSTTTSFDYALVGKGVTFDSGGLCLKPSKAMLGMHQDMGGAASVAAALLGAARTGAQVNAVAVIPLCENMTGSGAQKPGDIVKSMSGLTVEVIDTDAEGRLILADALHFVQEQFQPKRIVDVATLTGAMCVAVGPFASGIYANDEGLWAGLHASSQRSGDLAWRMPLWPQYDDLLKSELADLRNLGGTRDGGANSAARFLQRFIRPHQAWAHIDMAPVMSAPAYYGAKDRATGRPSRLLLDLMHSAGV